METLTYVEITPDHIDEIKAIYNYYVLNTTITFHTEPVNSEDMMQAVINQNPRYKSYLIQEAGETRGYVLLTQYKNRQAYEVCAEVTIYLSPSCLGAGIGTQALAFIESTAREQGFHTLLAIICMENTRSIQLFKKHGYDQCALLREVGVKFGRRLDIGFYQKMLE